jgi:hypothetical protein
MSIEAAARGSFHDYIRTRRFHHGRGSKAGWLFVIRALGDGDLPDASSWQELRTYLERKWGDPAETEAARVVWNSYLSWLTKKRRLGMDRAFGRQVYSDGSVLNCGAA